MISLLKLTNFQSHKKTELKLHPGVNCIVGSSDVGKTAIIRALRWLVWNRPSGDAFRSSWGGDTQVVVETNGNVVKRTKQSKNTISNSYTVNGDLLDAIRTDVPDIVRKTLNFDEINLQNQFDGPFLLNNSPGEVAVHFNRIAHLDVIDTAVKNVQSWLKKIAQNIESDGNRITELESQLDQFQGLEEIDNRLAATEKLEQTRANIVVRTVSLTRLITNIVQTQDKVDELEDVTSKSKLIDGTIALISSHQNVTATLSELRQHLTQTASLQRRQTDLERVIQLSTNVDTTLQHIEQRNEVKQRVTILLNSVSDIEQTNSDLIKTEQTAERLQMEFDKSFPDTCPLCGSRRRKDDNRRTSDLLAVQT